MTDATGADGRRAFVLGLDGVPWRLVREWTEDGTLENFARMRTEGVAAPLESTALANTPVAWPSIATGTRPDQHGVYEFVNLDTSYEQRLHTSADLQRPACWEVATPAVVGNVPMTYPPSEVDGRIVTGLMTPDTDATFTHPPEFAAEIRREIPEYRIELDWHEYVDDSDGFVDEIRSLLDARRRLLRQCMSVDDWRLFFFVFTAPDRLQHLVWDEPVLRDHYRLLDDLLGEVMAYCSDHDADLYVVSDHGFGPVSRAVNVNTVLESAGLFTRQRDDGSRSLLSRLGVTRDAVRSIPDRLGIDERTLVDALPDRVVNSVAQAVPGDHALFDMDRTETEAFLHGLGSVYVNDTERFAAGAVRPADVPAVKREVVRVLGDLTDPETGESPLRVYDGDDLYPRDEYGPDVVAAPRPGYTTNSSLASTPFESVDDVAGDHQREGVFLAWGPQVGARIPPADATVVDVAPTLLHGLGLPVPDHVDGEVLDVFAAGSAPAERPVETTALEHDGSDETVGESEAVKDRLRGLGYME